MFPYLSDAISVGVWAGVRDESRFAKEKEKVFLRYAVWFCKLGQRERECC
jgi:hypothetical protein